MHDDTRDPQLRYEYRFDFAGRHAEMVFPVLLDRASGIAVPPEGCRPEPWTRLDFHRCDICPLDKAKVEYCPIAFNISGLAAQFSSIFSIEEARITFTDGERTTWKDTTVQQGLRSILGIYLATSGCPHMNILKPMARFHLPFATVEETIWRHVGNYLLAQYFEYVNMGYPDITLEGLMVRNHNVDRVNHGICERLDNLSESDANRNALAILNTIGIMLNLELQGRLESLKSLYSDL